MSPIYTFFIKIKTTHTKTNEQDPSPYYVSKVSHLNDPDSDLAQSKD